MADIVRFDKADVLDRVLSDPNVQGPFMSFCATIAASAGTMVPLSLNSQEKVFAAIVTGHELGFSPMQACRSIYVVNGNVELKAAAMEALLERHGIRRKIVEWSANRCAIEMTRGDRVETFDYTMEEAVQAGDARSTKDGKPGMYEKRPKDMLYARCLSRGARKIAADILTGIYIEGELPPDPAPDALKTLSAVTSEAPAVVSVDAEFKKLSEGK